MTAPDRQKRRRRRQRPSPDAPLVLAVTIPGTTTRPSRLRALARPLAALASALPSYTLDRAGRARANLLRAAIGAASLLLVLASRGDLALGALAAAVAATLLVIPQPEHRKRRWIAAARGLAAPRALPIARPGALRYDGARLELRTTDDDRVHRSLRPHKSPVAIALADDDGGRLLLGLASAARTSDALVFRGPRPGDDALYDPLPTPTSVGPVAALRTGPPVEVDASVLAALLEAFWDPATGGLPRPPGPASEPGRPAGPRR